MKSYVLKQELILSKINVGGLRISINRAAW